MSLGYMNYNPAIGIQYPIYPYDSGMAYPPVGIPWPVPIVRGNAAIPLALPNQTPAVCNPPIQTPLVVTGRRSTVGNTVNGAPGAWAIGGVTALMVAVIVWIVSGMARRRPGAVMTFGDVATVALLSGGAMTAWTWWNTTK